MLVVFERIPDRDNVSLVPYSTLSSCPLQTRGPFYSSRLYCRSKDPIGALPRAETCEGNGGATACGALGTKSKPSTETSFACCGLPDKHLLNHLFSPSPTYMQTYIHTYIHTSTHPSIHPYMHTYMHTYVQYIHTYIHTHTYIQGTHCGQGHAESSHRCRGADPLPFSLISVYVCVCMYVCITSASSVSRLVFLPLHFFPTLSIIYFSMNYR